MGHRSGLRRRRLKGLRAGLTGHSAVAFAQDGTAPSASMPSADFLLSMGPYGALVWGAYLLGKGVKVTVQIELSERDRELIETVGKGRQ